MTDDPHAHVRAGLTQFSFSFDGTHYIWQATHTIDTLYGVAVRPSSLIPVGWVMTLCDMHGDVLLRLRGERHGDAIAFFHITDGREIGAWVPLRPVTLTTVETARQDDAQAAVRAKIADKLGWG